MKIVKVRSFVVGGFRCNWIFVKVYTDAGIDGVGEATLEFNERAVVAAIDSVGETLVGKDPFPAEVVRDTLIRDNYWRTNVVLRAALSGSRPPATRRPPQRAIREVRSRTSTLNTCSSRRLAQISARPSTFAANGSCRAAR